MEPVNMANFLTKKLTSTHLLVAETQRDDGAVVGAGQLSSNCR